MSSDPIAATVNKPWCLHPGNKNLPSRAGELTRFDSQGRLNGCGPPLVASRHPPANPQSQGPLPFSSDTGFVIGCARGCFPSINWPVAASTPGSARVVMPTKSGHSPCTLPVVADFSKGSGSTTGKAELTDCRSARSLRFPRFAFRPCA